MRPALAAGALALLMAVPPLDAVVARSRQARPVMPSMERVEPADASRAGNALVCGEGFTQLSLLRGTGIEDVITFGADAWAVGSRRVGDMTRRPLAMRFAEDRWRSVAAPSDGRDDGLMAVAGRGRDDLWAAGFTTWDGLLRPNALHWDGTRWRERRPPRQSSSGSTLTDITIADDGRPWAVGFAARAGGRDRPVVLRLDRGAWERRDPPMRAGASMTLTAVAPTRSGGLWVVGHTGRGPRIKALVLRREDGTWRRMRLPEVAGQAVLTDVAAASTTDAWAVGYQQVDDHTRPLVLRWDGTAWHLAPRPAVDADHVLLLALALPAAGGVWTVGSVRDEDALSYRSLAARWDGRSWGMVPSTNGGTELHSVWDAPDAGGWVVGRSGRGGVLGRVCPRYLATLPARPTGPAPSDEPWLDEVATAQAGGGGGTPRHRGRRQSRIRGLPRPGSHPSLVARDVTLASGLAEVTTTYGGVVTDFDADGDPDLYIGRHWAPGRLALNEGGIFRDVTTFTQPRVDRHGCAAADVDGSGLPDLLCTVGASRGSGLKANELWIDPAGGAVADRAGRALVHTGAMAPVEVAGAAPVEVAGAEPVDAAGPAHLVDPTGRGRLALFLRHDDDEALDVVLINEPSRVDGLPSPARLLRGSGDGRFEAVERTGFDPRLGAWAAEATDLDDDGRDELLLVVHGEQAPGTRGVRLYRNTPTGFVEARARLGVRSMGERDATFADVDGDGREDLVQLSPTRLRVSVWRAGRFRAVYERALTNARAVTAGDADGDGRADLFIVRRASHGRPTHVLLMNWRKGAGFRSVRLPPGRAGWPDTALAIDHDGNGMTDFLVLNGRQRRGPLQLIGFYRRQSERTEGGSAANKRSGGSRAHREGRRGRTRGR